MPQKLLVIAYYWPPGGGAGVQRWLKLSYYLAEMGVDVHVLTVDSAKASYPTFDESLLADVHPKVKVHTTNSFEPISLYARIAGRDKIPSGGFVSSDTGSWKQRLIMRLRTHLFIPDPRRGWRRFAVSRALKIVQEHDIHTVITTSPPHSVQLIGLALRQKANIHWIADLRDPWTDVYYYPLLLHSRLSAMLDKRYERRVLREADHLTTVSEGLKRLFLDSVPERKGTDISVIPNGYDPRDFAGDVKLPSLPGFTIGYTGTMSDQYKPDTFLEALSQVIAQRPAADIHLEIVGKISAGVKNKIDNLGIPIRLVPTVPHNEVNHYQRRANALFLALPQVKNGEGILTGKLFEYLASRRPIIALGIPGAEVGDVLKKTKSGRFFVNEEKNEMVAYILNLLDGELPFNPDEFALEAYSRKQQAEAFQRLLLPSER